MIERSIVTVDGTKINMSFIMSQAIVEGRCTRKVFRDQLLLMSPPGGGHTPNVNIYYCGATPILNEINAAVGLLSHHVSLASNDVPVHAEGFS